MMPTPRRLALLMSLAGFGASLGHAAQARTQLQAIATIEQLAAAGVRAARDRETSAAASFALAVDLTSAVTPETSLDTAGIAQVAASPSALPRRPIYRQGDGEQSESMVAPYPADDSVTAAPAGVQPAADSLQPMMPAPQMQGHSSDPAVPRAPATHRVGNGLRLRQPKGPPSWHGPWQSMTTPGDDPKLPPLTDDELSLHADAGSSAVGASDDATARTDRTAAALATEPPRRYRAYMPPARHSGLQRPTGFVAGTGEPLSPDSSAAAGIGIDIDLGRAVEVDIDVGRPAGVDVDLGLVMAVDLDLNTAAVDGKAAVLDLDFGAASIRDVAPRRAARGEAGHDRTAAVGADLSDAAPIKAGHGRVAAVVVDIDIGQIVPVDLDLDLDLDLGAVTVGGLAATQRIASGEGIRSLQTGRSAVRPDLAAAGPAPGLDPAAGAATRAGSGVDFRLDGYPAPALRWHDDVPAEPIFVATDPAKPTPTTANGMPAGRSHRLATDEPPPIGSALAPASAVRQALRPSRAVSGPSVIEPAGSTAAWPARGDSARHPVPGPLSEMVAVAETSLDKVRGGFQTDTGLQISFGIERAFYINGSLVAPPTMNVVDPGGVPAARCAACRGLSRRATWH